MLCPQLPVEVPPLPAVSVPWPGKSCPSQSRVPFTPPLSPGGCHFVKHHNPCVRRLPSNWLAGPTASSGVPGSTSEQEAPAHGVHFWHHLPPCVFVLLCDWLAAIFWTHHTHMTSEYPLIAHFLWIKKCSYINRYTFMYIHKHTGNTICEYGKSEQNAVFRRMCVWRQ